MSWTKTKSRGPIPTGRVWSQDEVEALIGAVRRAPSVHNSQPWSLEVRDRRAALSERPDEKLLRHDPEGRDRRISCGAALANLVLAIRHAGWTAEVRWADHDDPPDLIATVVAQGHHKPTAIEGQRYRAINRRASYRRAFDDQALPHSTRETLWAAATPSGGYARWIVGSDEALALARLLTYAGRVFHDDLRYQRELAAWTVEPAEDNGAQGIPGEAFGAEGLPAVGLATSETHLPDERTLASLIEAESVLVLSTATDDRTEHLRAGEAMELAWLGATSLGLVVSVMTQPLQLSEVRTGLADRLGIPGVPEVLMRFGYPKAEVPRSSRRPPSDITSEESAADDE